MTALLEVYKKNLTVVEKPFEGDTGFQAALDKVRPRSSTRLRQDPMADVYVFPSHG